MPKMQATLGKYIKRRAEQSGATMAAYDPRIFYIHDVEFGGAIELPLAALKKFDFSAVKDAFSVGVAAKTHLDLSFGGAIPALPLITGHIKVDLTALGVRAFVKGGMKVDSFFGIDGFHAQGDVAMELTLGWAGGLPSLSRILS